MRYPLLRTRKSIVILLNAPRIDFLACLFSLLYQVWKVGTYRPVRRALVHYLKVPCFGTKLSLLIKRGQAINLQDWCYYGIVVWLLKQLWQLSVGWYCDCQGRVIKLSLNQFIRSSLARESCFSRVSLSREKRPLASTCPFVCPRVALWMSLDGIPWNLVLGTCMEICRENLAFV